MNYFNMFERGSVIYWMNNDKYIFTIQNLLISGLFV